MSPLHSLCRAPNVVLAGDTSTPSVLVRATMKVSVSRRHWHTVSIVKMASTSVLRVSSTPTVRSTSPLIEEKAAIDRSARCRPSQ